MPKESVKEFNLRMVKKFPKILRGDSSVLYCVVCNCKLNKPKLYNVEQHFSSLKHKVLVEKYSSSTTQSLLTDTTTELNPYILDLCNTFLSANIPLYKINNPAVKEFLTKYTKKPVPSETLLRTKYMPTIYEKCIKELQNRAGKSLIWVSMDETTDSEQRMVASFVFGILEEGEKETSYLLNIAHIEKANASSMAAFFTDSLQILWPNGKFEFLFNEFMHVFF